MCKRLLRLLPIAKGCNENFQLKVPSDLSLLSNNRVSLSLSALKLTIPRWHVSCAKGSTMSWTDAFVIYLSIAAPFGVYHYFASPRRDRRTVPWALLNGIAWLIRLPGFLHTIVKSRLNRSRSLSNDLETLVLRRVAAGLALCKASDDLTGVFEIQEVLERYVGISKMLEATGNGASGTSDLWSVSGHPDPSTAALVRQRTNRENLRRHRTEAINELLSLVRSLDPGNDKSPAAVNSVAELFLKYGNEIAADEVIGIGLGSVSNHKRASRPGRLLWNLTQPLRTRNGSPAVKIPQIVLTSNLPRDD